MSKKEVVCDTCKKIFWKYECKIGKHNFCCQQCYNEFHSRNTKFYTCEICGKQFKGQPKNANRFCSRECYNEFHNIKEKERECPTCHKIFIAKASEDKYCSWDCYNKDRHMPAGENHWNWKGGISELSSKRDSANYKKWRLEIFKRDNYRCKQCGSKNNINAHHIYSYNKYPEKRYDLNNGITLCEKCHIALHKKYGYDTEEPINISGGDE